MKKCGLLILFAMTLLATSLFAVDNLNGLSKGPLDFQSILTETKISVQEVSLSPVEWTVITVSSLYIGDNLEILHVVNNKPYTGFEVVVEPDKSIGDILHLLQFYKQISFS